VHEQQRQRVRVGRPDVQEVDRLAVDLGHELRQGVQARLVRGPVVGVAPVAGEVAHEVERRSQSPARRTIARRQQVVDPGEAFDGVLHRVVALNRLFGAAGEALARPAGQTLARYLVLREAQREGAPVADIARRLRLARQGVQRIADALAREGLVAYAENPRHRRAKLVTLTDHGRSALDQVAAAQRVWARQLGEQLGSDKLAQLNALLDDVLRITESA